VDLPEFPKVNDAASPDVRFCIKTWPAALSESADSVPWYQSASQSVKIFLLSQGELFLIRYIDGADFLIHHSGSQVWCRWDQTISFDYVRSYLYGPIVGFLLRLRGWVCLHASVIGMRDWAVAFTGPAEAGKSTLAAAMAGEGFPIISDDILILSEVDGAFRAIPAYPRIRLWPSSVYALWGSSEALPRISEGWDKRHLTLPADRFETRHQPLGAIYLLSGRSEGCDASRIEALQGLGALRSLIANTYALKIFDKEMRAYEFEQLSRLANQVPLRSLTPFSDISRIRHLCDLIISDFQKLRWPHTPPLPVS
jgi:hypothetical protein